MALVRVRANLNVYGLTAGDLGDVDDTNTEIAALITAGYLTPVDAPAAPADTPPAEPGTEGQPTEPVPYEPTDASETATLPPDPPT